MKTGKIIGAGLAAAGIVVAGYLVWQKFFTEQAPALLTAAVSRGDVEETVLATGTLKPVRLVAVGAQVSGRITAVNVELGQSVEAGDLIAEIDSVTQENALRTAEASLANLKAQRQEREATLALNEKTLARQERMLQGRAVSQADYESALAAVAEAQAQIASLDAQITAGEIAIETARADLGYTRITAPIDGTVLAIVSQEGQTVNATQSTPTIVILGQLETMTVRAEISEADIVKVAPGQPLWFTIVGEPDRRHDAVLESIEPAPESIRNDTSITSSMTTSTSTSSSEAIYYNGIFNVPNADGRLRTYMTAQVNIVLGQARGVLTVPASALGARGADGLYAVRLVAANGDVTERRVGIGLNDKVTAEVLSGLAEGDVVVTGEATAEAASNGFGGGPGGPPMGF
ncbi:MAG: efflux RND transporter periplasmic adaptor subunit [Aquamicrobium sp.]|nr:efflux RND transporter periplasmic adaptor subunit [Aquamicrobium sp.]